MNKHLVFVYGTLRRGGLRAMPDLFPGAEFVGGASVSGCLYDLGAHPGLLAGASGSSVVGELYEVDDETLNRLDDLEAPSHYRRRRIEASLGSRRAACWVYEPDPEFYPRRILIASGDWIEYAERRGGAGGLDGERRTMNDGLQAD
ncbi:MAG TPA: gamma-glutamylcyclotransferase family protein [Pyrinomonadaceae bacterium]|jgi:gamma-glutamylcyclotransferase (GGCT)/AIG2-like uncharacterized protein YtfP